MSDIGCDWNCCRREKGFIGDRPEKVVIKEQLRNQLFFIKWKICKIFVQGSMNFYLKVASGNANLQIGLLKMNHCAIFRYDILSVVKTLNWKIKRKCVIGIKILIKTWKIFGILIQFIHFFLIFQK